MGGIEYQILSFINQVYTTIGWAGVVVLMAIESCNIPLPSEVIMPLSGWMLIKNQGLSAWYIVLAGLYGAIGCTIGSAISYWIGALGGRPFIERYGKYILISRHDLDLADRWFKRYGDWTAFFSRLLPVIRTFISFPAGITRMNFPRFLLYTFIGSFFWSLALAYGGYQLGEHWEDIRNVMRPFDIPIILILVALFGLFLYRHIRRAIPSTE